jgi:uncharacterized protein (DUF433 family)
MQKAYVEERNGALYVVGTRVSLDSIVHCFREGLSPESILSEFDTLTLGQIYGAIAYYLDQQPAIDAYMLRQKQRAAAMRAAQKPLPESLGERIDAAREQLRSEHTD